MSGGTIDSHIRFGVTDIELPPTRGYYNVNCTGGDTYFRLECFSMDFIREEFRSRASYELPPVQGNWDNVQLWVDNLWEAMYNPLWMRKYEDGSIGKRWDYGVFDGHHRMRLFDALDANCIWGYVQNIKHFVRPSWVKNILISNKRSPRRGTFSGPCPKCREDVRYKAYPQENHRLIGGILKCSRCGEIIDYPWPGVL